MNYSKSNFLFEAPPVLYQPKNKKEVLEELDYNSMHVYVTFKFRQISFENFWSYRLKICKKLYVLLVKNRIF